MYINDWHIKFLTQTNRSEQQRSIHQKLSKALEYSLVVYSDLHECGVTVKRSIL